MPKKEICEHCISSYSKRFLNEENMQWKMQRFHAFWKGGWCACRVVPDPFLIYDEDSPDDCPYIVEQAVNQC
jgi:hypothetical protein